MKKERQIGKRFWIIIACTVTFTLVTLAGGAYIYKKRLSRESAFEKGVIYARLHRHPDAVAEYKKALVNYSDNPNIHYNLGLSYFSLKQYKDALAEFKSAIDIKPDFSEAALELAFVYVTLGDEAKKQDAESPLALKHYAKAEGVCNEIILKDPKYIKAYDMLGHINIARERLGEATSNFRDAVEIDPKSVSSNIALVKHYMSLGRIDEADTHCMQFLEKIDPECNDIRLILSSIREKQGRYDDAIAELKTIIGKEPKNLDAHIQLGLLYLRTGKYDDASAEVEKIAEINERITVVKYITGCINLQKGELPKAITNLRDATIRMPTSWESHYYLALALRGSNKVEEAKTELNTVIELVPEFTPARIVLAELLSEDGWYDEVVKHCKMSLEYEPESIEAMQLLGIAYTEQKRYDDAEEEFDKILEIEPTIGLKNMAYLNLAKRKLSKCIKQCNEAIEIDPKDARLHYILAEAYRRKGSVEDALKELEETLRINPSYPAAQLTLAQIQSALGKEDDAIKVFNDIISARPESLPPRIQLANLYRKRNETDKAIEVLKRTIEIDPNYYPAYILADIYFMQGRVDESIDLYRKASLLSNKKPTLPINLAIAYQQKGDYDAAFEACQQGLDIRTQNAISVYTVLTNLHISQGTYAKAITSIKEANDLADDQKEILLRFIDICQTNEDKGKEAAMSLNQAVLYGNSGMYDLAIEQCKEAASNLQGHQEIMTHWVMATLHLSSGQLADAAKTYNKIIKIESNLASLHTELGNVYLLMGEIRRAKDAFLKAISINDKTVPALLVLSNLYIKEGLYSDATKRLEQVLSYDPKSLTARGMLAGYYLSIGKYGEAEGYLKEMLRLNPSSYLAYSMLARVRFATGQFDDCIEMCKICLQRHPEDVQMRNVLGLVYTRKGDVKAALSEFGEIIDIDDNFAPAYIELGRLNLLTGQPKVASELYKKALSINPEAIAAQHGLGNAYTQMGLHNQAIETFNTILKDHPEHVNSYISLAETYFVAGDSVKALETVEKALDIAPKNVLAYTLLARIHKKEGNLGKTVTALKQVLEYNPKSLTGYEAGVIYIDQGKFDDAIAVYQKGVENYPGQASMHFHLAVAYQLKGDYMQAINSCGKAANLEPNNTSPLLGLVNVLIAQGNFPHAKARIKVWKNIPQDTRRSYLKFIDFCSQNQELGIALTSYLNTGLIYSINRWYERAINAYEEVQKIIPDNPFILSTLANVQLASGREKEAIENYTRALAKNPNDFFAHFMLAQTMQKKNKYDEAIDHYQHAILANQESYAAHLNLGMLLEMKGEIERCIEEYNTAISLDPSNPTPYNNLAWIYATNTILPDAGSPAMDQKLDEALKLAWKAKELSPEHAPIRDTLGWIYHLKGMNDEALSELENAVNLAPNNPIIRYHMATIYREKGFKRRALVHFEKAIQINEHFPEADLARKAIDAIKSGKSF
ncbi:MAG: tetratricopeptide repeat protein [Candidatus Brocadiales bacterium]